MNARTESQELLVSGVRRIMSEIVRALVSRPSEVVIEVLDRDDGDLVMMIGVQPEDADVVIGQQGRILKALQTFCHALSVKNNARIHLKIRVLTDQ